MAGLHYKRKIRENRYDDMIANDMLALLTVSFEVEINQLFNNIEKTDAEWAAYYRQKWIIASLNKHMSKIDNETWQFYSRDRGLITHNVLSNKRQANARVKKLNNTNKTVLTKRKQNARASSNEDKCNNNDNDKENNVTKSLSKSDESEYQEALKERELDLGKEKLKFVLWNYLTLKKNVN
ncbi:hypothetical protein C1646_752732 [Rhizophagus diaphanus]|nr:hypothetical protein C1646_752732 [Rhizophagus diaphanus] [Rhizophagus sp. MUCL 43196]